MCLLAGLYPVILFGTKNMWEMSFPLSFSTGFSFLPEAFFWKALFIKAILIQFPLLILILIFPPKSSELILVFTLLVFILGHFAPVFAHLGSSPPSFLVDKLLQWLIVDFIFGALFVKLFFVKTV